ncbi:hypothetical protein NDU88_002512 [Pleurodeles waltl]|uniref:Uncharacterized protein n=1 Tax=Pleurodeles waltl TaxID=8319 RepID=A0AAV7RCX7_PLEWA|nr:hypothetical protein NDU88_002512 [Pleurodeles waltl]
MCVLSPEPGGGNAHVVSGEGGAAQRAGVLLCCDALRQLEALRPPVASRPRLPRCRWGRGEKLMQGQWRRSGSLSRSHDPNPPPSDTVAGGEGE